MYETCTVYRYSKRSSVATITLLLLHLAELPRPGLSIQWQFLPEKSTLCETPESVVSGGFIWFHQTSPSKFDIQIVSKPLKEEDTLFASHGTWRVSMLPIPEMTEA